MSKDSADAATADETRCVERGKAKSGINTVTEVLSTLWFYIREGAKRFALFFCGIRTAEMCRAYRTAEDPLREE
ncbi:MAG: hypothetical protein J6U26_03655 [Lachnospiraceae bacterium]|nr:hypothetical protein [Lachnospiraceae bacterium]